MSKIPLEVYLATWRTVKKGCSGQVLIAEKRTQSD